MLFSALISILKWRFVKVTLHAKVTIVISYSSVARLRKDTLQSYVDFFVTFLVILRNYTRYSLFSKESSGDKPLHF